MEDSETCVPVGGPVVTSSLTLLPVRVDRPAEPDEPGSEVGTTEVGLPVGCEV
jgi:hypothetical protein